MSLRKAIDAKCKDCIYDPYAPGNWRQQVHACTATDCPLYPVRPRSAKPLTREQYGVYHNVVPESVTHD